MDNKNTIIDIELICVIVNYGLGSKILKTAKKNGIHGVTITIAKGTVQNKILQYMGLSEVKKEMLYMVADKETAYKETAYKVLDVLNTEYKFDKPNHGIAFTTSICAAEGTKIFKLDYVKGERGEDITMYQVITSIVDKGKAEDVIEAASKAGSKGCTIIKARGSGIHETSKLFSMDIEPEKGIIYIQDTNKTYGIYRQTIDTI